MFCNPTSCQNTVQQASEATRGFTLTKHLLTSHHNGQHYLVVPVLHSTFCLSSPIHFPPSWGKHATVHLETSSEDNEGTQTQFVCQWFHSSSLSLLPALLSHITGRLGTSLNVILVKCHWTIANHWKNGLWNKHWNEGFHKTWEEEHVTDPKITLFLCEE